MIHYVEADECLLLQITEGNMHCQLCHTAGEEYSRLECSSGQMMVLQSYLLMCNLRFIASGNEHVMQQFFKDELSCHFFKYLQIMVRIVFCTLNIQVNICTVQQFMILFFYAVVHQMCRDHCQNFYFLTNIYSQSMCSAKASDSYFYGSTTCSLSFLHFVAYLLPQTNMKITEFFLWLENLNLYKNGIS